MSQGEDAQDALIGKTLGGYRVIRKLGHGGMGVVYEAQQESLQRRVAVKVLRPEMSNDKAFVERFHREALAAARLRHPNIVQIYDIGDEGGIPFFSMELVDGMSLDDLLTARGPMSVDHSAKLIKQVAGALEHARRAGIVHRDIKPSNILLDRMGLAKIVDLGLAKALEAAAVHTQTSVILGTPHYMAPEQSESTHDVDTRADIYSLGITWYHALVGKPPFQGRTPVQIIMRHHTDPLPPLGEARGDVPESISRIIMRMAAKRPEDRYQTPSQVVRAIRNFQAGKTIEEPRVQAPPPKPAPPPAQPVQKPPKPDGVISMADLVAKESKRPQPKRKSPSTIIGRKWQRHKAYVIAGAVFVLACLALLMLPENGEGEPSAPKPPAPAPRGDMVAIPAGKLHRGSGDESVTARLLSKYKLAGGSALVQLFETPERTVNVKGFLIDAYEVTNVEYRLFLADVAKYGARKYRHLSQPIAKNHTPQYWDDARYNQPEQPVVGIDWYDAYSYAKWAGKRLLTEDEWELAARGKDKRPYPWGSQYSDRRYYQGDERPAKPMPVSELRPYRPGEPVGIAGNVAEWTSSGQEGDKMMFVRGGAWNRAPGEVYAVTFLRTMAERDTRDAGMGLRCAKDDPGGPVPSRMLRIAGGQVRLGGDDTPLLRLMRRHKDAISNVDEVFLGEEPQTVSVRAFQVDRTEVTNAQYRRFLEDIERKGDEAVRHRDQPAGKNHTPRYWFNAEYNKPRQPVVGVDWFDAYAYAKWARKRLPTRDEWQRAARGDTRRLYPWGDEFDASNCVCLEARASGPAPVGPHPRGRSPLGVTNMAGNVMEWTDDDFDGAPGNKVLRGGAWNVQCEIYGLTYLRCLGAERTHRDKNVGFRCVAAAGAKTE